MQLAKESTRITTDLSSSARGTTLWFGIAVALSLVGLADSVYLTAQRLAGETIRCTVTSGCDEVLSSSYATIAGFPVSGLGAVAYFTVFSAATLAAFGYRGARNVLAIAVAMMFAMTLWFLYVQAFILQKFCEYCLLSAAATTCLVVVVSIERALASKKDSTDA